MRHWVHEVYMWRRENIAIDKLVYNGLGYTVIPNTYPFY